MMQNLAGQTQEEVRFSVFFYIIRYEENKRKKKDLRLQFTIHNTYMAIPRNPFNGATPHITPRITAIICRSQ